LPQDFTHTTAWSTLTNPACKLRVSMSRTHEGPARRRTSRGSTGRSIKRASRRHDPRTFTVHSHLLNVRGEKHHAVRVVDALVRHDRVVHAAVAIRHRRRAQRGGAAPAPLAREAVPDHPPRQLTVKARVLRQQLVDMTRAVHILARQLRRRRRFRPQQLLGLQTQRRSRAVKVLLQ
jgi:hypothetical protein